MNIVQSCIDAQKKYCIEKKVPHFAPDNGICWSCNQNIYLPGKDGYAGVPLEKASTQHITGCTHCHRTYCD